MNSHRLCSMGLGAILAAASATAGASPPGRSLTPGGIGHQVVEAPVVGVQPLVRTVSERIPHRRCYDERIKVLYATPHSPTSGILGAVVGGTVAGALGHNSRHQPLIAGAGALLGASVGTDIAHRRSEQAHYTTERRCEVEYELRDREEVTGYRVSYRYGGSIYHTRMAYRPGKRIRLRVDLHPLD